MPKIPKGTFKVKRGNDFITVSPYVFPRSKRKGWRFGYQPKPGLGNPWSYVTRMNRDDIVTSAEEILKQRVEGLIWLDLPTPRRRFLEAVHAGCKPEDEAALLSFIASRQKSCEVGAAVAQFLAFKIHKAGEETPHLSKVRGVLEGMAEAFAGTTVADIHRPELAEWWAARCKSAGSKRQNDIRANLVMFWLWCQSEEIIPKSSVTAAERLPTSAVEHTDPTIYTPAGFLRLARAAAPEDRPSIVLGAFAGLRPEECAPGGDKKKRKRGLRGEEIDWTFGVIRLPKEVSKGGKRARIIPMSEALKVWLEWAGVTSKTTGPVCPRNLSDSGETRRLGLAVFGGEWPHDALRHSYGTYRNAILRSLQQVAEEMGTSEKMLHAHYHNPRAANEGAAWFDLRPELLIASDKLSPGEIAPPLLIAATR